MLKSILAGALIGVGNIAMMKVESPYVGALIFSIALLAIIQLRLLLFTGKIGNVIHTHNWFGYSMILFGNVIGVVLTMLIFVGMDVSNYDLIRNVAEQKFSRSSADLFFAAFLCNVLIHIAVKCKRELITVLCIMGFILCGFEHSIADAGYAFVAINPNNILLWLFIVVGNACGGIATEFLLSYKVQEAENS